MKKNPDILITVDEMINLKTKKGMGLQIHTKTQHADNTYFVSYKQGIWWGMWGGVPPCECNENGIIKSESRRIFKYTK